MALTGVAGGAASISPASVLSMLSHVVGDLAAATAKTGARVCPDPAVLLTGRAALAGYTRRGQVSASGGTRLLRAPDGWCAISLGRSEDRLAIPAILGCLGLDSDVGAGADEPWSALASAALARGASALVSAARLLAVPASVLSASSPGQAGPQPSVCGTMSPSAGPACWPPWRNERIADPVRTAGLAGAVVADLSSMWAGPLCARLLGMAGARVIKVETPGRPDGARAGNRRFFDWLHTGHSSLIVDLRTTSGRDALADLLAVADVVIEASRPRALANLGLAPDMIPHRDGQVWLSITGYGRNEPDLVAFGDDAAVAGGLVGWVDGDPVFCADAIADPLTGVCGALAVARSAADGGGQLIDLSMHQVAASFAAASGEIHGAHHLGPGSKVTCERLGQDRPVLPPRCPIPCRPAASFGTDTDAVLSWLAAC